MNLINSLKKLKKESMKNEIEFASILVLPIYQRKKIGSAMITFMENQLKLEGINTYYLDSGYETSQKIWTRKYGKAAYIIKDSGSSRVF